MHLKKLMKLCFKNSHFISLSFLYHIKQIPALIDECCPDGANLEGMGFTVVPFGQGVRNISPSSAIMKNEHGHASDLL
jgi:hypothetical protein